MNKVKKDLLSAGWVTGPKAAWMTGRQPGGNIAALMDKHGVAKVNLMKCTFYYGPDVERVPKLRRAEKSAIRPEEQAFIEAAVNNSDVIAKTYTQKEIDWMKTEEARLMGVDDKIFPLSGLFFGGLKHVQSDDKKFKCELCKVKIIDRQNGACRDCLSLGVIGHWAKETNNGPAERTEENVCTPDRCLFCRFYVDGQCHHRSPAIKIRSGYLAVWPVVDVDDWCGEWKAKEGKAER